MADARVGEAVSVPEASAAIQIDNLVVNYGRHRAV